VLKLAKKENKKKQQTRNVETAPGFGDKKNDGPNRPST
jgi:hypothetical protein